jgi:glycosyltransferase involved in cell wall biosynthesis
LSALRARGHRVCLVTYPSGRDIDGIETVRSPWPGRTEIQVGSSWLKIALDAVLLPTALRAAQRFQPDIIHAYLHEGALIGTLLGRLFRVPLVFDFQGSLTSEMVDHRFISAGSPWLPPLRWLERWINRQPDAILASSTHAATPLITRDGLDASRVTTLHDSVNPSYFRPADSFDPDQLTALRQRLGLPEDRRVLVYLGLLAPYQGTDLLLEAMARLVQTNPDVHLLLMGFPFVERYRCQARALGLENRVTFTGAVPYEEAPVHLVLGDVAVAPKLSATEGSGKLLPYMAAALPVVAFDTPVHREYLGYLGAYARPGDADDLASVVAALLANPGAASQRGRALREAVSTTYTWKNAASKIAGIYKKLLRKPPRVL